VSGWTHRICEGCWHTRNPGRDPVVYRGDDAGTCCVCGARTEEPWIYFRADPKSLKCEGKGPEHEETEP
jgi:hypothetical protein